MQYKQPNEGLGCAAMIIAACVGIALIMWAHQGFPGLPH
jgi:choline-glycine betaine transporter